MIYLDHHAMSPLVPEARAAWERARDEAWANPSSPHTAGRRAKALLEEARRQVAAALGAHPADLVFTSGGTEACHLGVRGLRPERVLSTAFEHPAVEGALEDLEVARLPMAGGPPTPEALRAALDRVRPGLCALQWVNHELGTRFPVPAYAAVCREAGVPLFVDATQAFGKLDVDVRSLGADLVAVASTKIGGPAGAGALWVRRGRPIAPLVGGGGQERGRRPGTPDVAAAAGFGAACAVLPRRRARVEALAPLRDRLEAGMAELGMVLNGTEWPRVPTVAHGSAPALSGPLLVAALDLEGVQASHGAACSSGIDAPSPVLQAAYPGEPWRARNALRLSLGPDSTAGDVDGALEALARVLAR